MTEEKKPDKKSKSKNGLSVELVFVCETCGEIKADEIILKADPSEN